MGKFCAAHAANSLALAMNKPINANDIREFSSV